MELNRMYLRTMQWVAPTVQRMIYLPICVTERIVVICGTHFVETLNYFASYIRRSKKPKIETREW